MTARQAAKRQIMFYLKGEQTWSETVEIVERLTGMASETRLILDDMR